MKLIALVPARNEEWVIGASLRIALRWNDEVVVLAHACTDATVDIVREIQAEHPDRVHLIAEAGQNWAEMDHRQRLLLEARKHGATHISIVDCDEILTGNLLGTIRDQIAALPAGGFIHVGMPCVWRSLTRFRVDGRIWANRFDLCLAFADSPDLCWRPTEGYDHHHREPHGARLAFRSYGMNGGVMHLQWANWRRLLAKQTHYQMMERLKYPDKSAWEIAHRYSFAMDEAGLHTDPTPTEWWDPYGDLRKSIDIASPSWHEQECERLIAEHGLERFSGLNLANLEMANAGR